MKTPTLAHHVIRATLVHILGPSRFHVSIVLQGKLTPISIQPPYVISVKMERTVRATRQYASNVLQGKLTPISALLLSVTAVPWEATRR